MKTQTKQITRSNERMHTRIDWLDRRHSFSFGGHYDPERMGFGPLRVVNEDRVAPGGGFPSHPHSDMEIISIVLDGQLAHRDSLGNGRVIEGKVGIEGESLTTGDSVALTARDQMTLKNEGPSRAKVMFFDLPVKA